MGRMDYNGDSFRTRVRKHVLQKPHLAGYSRDTQATDVHNGESIESQEQVVAKVNITTVS